MSPGARYRIAGSVKIASSPTGDKSADRTYFAPGYYAAIVADFDGNRLEFVHKAWNRAR